MNCTPASPLQKPDLIFSRKMASNKTDGASRGGIEADQSDPLVDKHALSECENLEYPATDAESQNRTEATQSEAPVAKQTFAESGNCEDLALEDEDDLWTTNDATKLSVSDIMTLKSIRNDRRPTDPSERKEYIRGKFQQNRRLFTCQRGHLMISKGFSNICMQLKCNTCKTSVSFDKCIEFILDTWERANEDEVIYASAGDKRPVSSTPSSLAPTRTRKPTWTPSPLSDKRSVFMAKLEALETPDNREKVLKMWNKYAPPCKEVAYTTYSMDEFLDYVNLGEEETEPQGGIDLTPISSAAVREFTCSPASHCSTGSLSTEIDDIVKNSMKEITDTMQKCQENGDHQTNGDVIVSANAKVYDDRNHVISPGNLNPPITDQNPGLRPGSTINVPSTDPNLETRLGNIERVQKELLVNQAKNQSQLDQILGLLMSQKPTHSDSLVTSVVNLKSDMSVLENRITELTRLIIASSKGNVPVKANPEADGKQLLVPSKAPARPTIPQSDRAIKVVAERPPGQSLSYSSIASRLMELDQKWTDVSRKKPGTPALQHKPVTQPTPAPKGPPQTKKTYAPLPADQLDRVLAGMSPKPTRRITALYATGIMANRIGIVKRVLAGNCGVNMSDVPHISFIGRSIAEFHIYVDRVALFKSKVSDTLPGVNFIDIDPLDPGLFKDEEVVDKIVTAAKMVSKRLQQRFEQTPVTSHRRFLSGLLKRSKEQIESGKFTPLITIPEPVPEETIINDQTMQQ